VDNDLIPRFCLSALDSVAELDNITILSCTNTSNRLQPIEYFGYYALNLFTVRNPLTRRVPVQTSIKTIIAKIDFESNYQGAWQALPERLIDDIKAGGFDLILKFGMDLLRIPEDGDFPPILSFHHGDPEKYRGRPAGFWEMFEGAPVVGQMVQVLSNHLDAGKIAAYAETKIHRHSYRATLIEAYSHSPLLLRGAVRAIVAHDWVEKPASGKLYRLPSNSEVVKFVLKMGWTSLKRLHYGFFYEKRWRVSVGQLPADPLADSSSSVAIPDQQTWHTLPIGNGYSFYADPFFSSDPPGILVEALNRRTGLGEILLIGDNGEQRLTHTRRHFSYPCTIMSDGAQLIVPEVAEWSQPRYYTIKDGLMHEQGLVEVEGHERILDPTMVEHEGKFYVFGNIASFGSGALFLWWSDKLAGPFALHPAAPVRISPRGARMAGGIQKKEDRIIRFGQDFTAAYGDGVFTFEVLELTCETYREAMVGHVRLPDRSGPHTLNFRDGKVVFDWYDDRFDASAGIRRLLGRLRRKSPNEAAQALRVLSRRWNKHWPRLPEIFR
jgi:hypothetical protein